MGKKSAISKSACERPQNVAEASVLHNDLEDANSNISTKDSYEKLEKPELQEADVEKSKVLMCTDVSAVTLQSKKKKKKAFKSMFPLTNALENRGKEYALDNCISLADKLTEVPVENNAVSSVHLALYGSRIDAYKLLKAEGEFVFLLCM